MALTGDQIIEHAEFKKALKKSHDDLVKTYVSSSREMIPITKLYKHELQATDQLFDTLSTSANYKIGGAQVADCAKLIDRGQGNRYSLIDEAFTRPKRWRLLGHLASLLEMPVLGYYRRLKAGHIGDPVSQDELDTFLDSGCYALMGVTNIGNNFRHNIQLACDRIVQDWDDIETLFFQNRTDIKMPNMVSLKLLEFHCIGSDPHKGGKQVYIIDFAMIPQNPDEARKVQKRKYKGVVARLGNGTPVTNVNTLNVGKTVVNKLVYKPGDMELDCRLVGKMDLLGMCLPHRINDLDWIKKLPNRNVLSLFEIINQHVGSKAIPAIKLPTYRILPRGCGSNMPNPNANPLPIQSSYGFIEFLTHEPKAINDSGRTENSKTPDKPSDWIAETKKQVRDYYLQFGWIVAVAKIFGMADAHQENLIVHRLRPYLIDCEISFKIRTEQLGNTGLHDVLGEGKPPKHKCQLFLKGNPWWTVGADAAKFINFGMKDAYKLLATNPGGCLTNWINNVHMQSVIARFVPLATKDYGRTRYGYSLQRPNDPAPDQDDSDDPEFDGTSSHFQWKGTYKSWYNGIGAGIRPNFAMACYEHDWKCNMNIDYPCYYRQLGNKDLMNARGLKVSVKQPEAGRLYTDVGASRNRLICGPHYFDHYPSVYRFTIPGERDAAFDDNEMRGNLRQVFDEITRFLKRVYAMEGYEWEGYCELVFDPIVQIEQYKGWVVECWLMGSRQHILARRLNNPGETPVEMMFLFADSREHAVEMMDQDPDTFRGTNTFFFEVPFRLKKEALNANCLRVLRPFFKDNEMELGPNIENDAGFEDGKLRRNLRDVINQITPFLERAYDLKGYEWEGYCDLVFDPIAEIEQNRGWLVKCWFLGNEQYILARRLNNPGEIPVQMMFLFAANPEQAMEMMDQDPNTFRGTNSLFFEVPIGYNEKDNSHWRINDGNRVFHILKTSEGNEPFEVKVYEAGNAIEMIARQFALIQDDTYRANMITQTEAEVQHNCGRHNRAAHTF